MISFYLLVILHFITTSTVSHVTLRHTCWYVTVSETDTDQILSYVYFSCRSLLSTHSLSISCIVQSSSLPYSLCLLILELLLVLLLVPFLTQYYHHLYQRCFLSHLSNSYGMSSCRIDGGVTGRDRQRIIDDFNKGKNIDMMIVVV